MNIHTTNWSTYTRNDGITNILDAHGTVIASCTDWQVAEKILAVTHEHTLDAEKIANLEDQVLDLESGHTEEISDLKEQHEADVSAIKDLEQELDNLATKLYNATH